MKQKLLFLLAALFAVATGAHAQITLQEPVVSDTYIKFVGENATNNYRFTLDTYEWEDRGPQFQITVEPLDDSKAAQFTTADLSDDNYWEPMFRAVTKQMAGEEMTAQNNIKRLYIKNVAVLANQFHDYQYLKAIGIEAAGDYTIPDGSFSGCDHLESLDCNVQGTLALGKTIVNSSPDFSVKVYTKQSAEAWRTYKDEWGGNFKVDASEVEEEDETPSIVSVKLNLTVNDENRVFDLPDAGGKQKENAAIVRYVLNGFTAQTKGDVTELFMEYCAYPEGQSGQQHQWKRINAVSQGNGVWSFEGPTVNGLDGMESYKETYFEFSFITNTYGEHGDRAHYPTNSQTIYIKFYTGDLSTDIESIAATDTSDGAWYTLDGIQLEDEPTEKGVYIYNGKKVLVQ